MSRVRARTDFEHILEGGRVSIEYEFVDLLAAFDLDTVNGSVHWQTHLEEGVFDANHEVPVVEIEFIVAHGVSLTHVGGGDWHEDRSVSALSVHPESESQKGSSAWDVGETDRMTH